MVFVRYDHRKLAYNQVKFKKKRRRSAFFDYGDLPDDKVFSSTFGGTLGGGKNQTTNAASFANNERKTKTFHKGNRRGTIHISARARNQLELKFDENESGDCLLSPPTMTRIDESFIEFDGCKDDVTDVDTLSNVMVHLEEKQKKRNQEKRSEEFANIKSNFEKIFSDYGFKEESEGEGNESFDMRILTDPNFLTNEDEEKNSTKNVIEKILDFYANVCQERSDILENLHDCMDTNEEEIENSFLKRLHVATSNHSDGENELEDISSEITMTIENIGRKSQKLKRLYNKLLKLCVENRADAPLKGNFESETGRKVREMNLQQKVVGQFKKIHLTKNVRKEKVETWKYAANEIVDLLKSVRQEGATDFERLEKEFKRLLDAFNAQSELLQEVQLKLDKKDESLKKNEAIREKLRNDNMILQDDIDRYRVQNRTAQMKIQQLQGDIQIKDKEIKEKSEVVSKKLATVLPNANDEEVEIASNIISNVDNKELYDKINALQKAVTKYENEIQQLNLKNIQLVKEIEEMRNGNKNVDLSLQDSTNNGNLLTTLSNQPGAVQRMPSSYNAQDCYECQTKQLKINKLLKKIQGLVEEKDLLIQKFAESTNQKPNFGIESNDDPEISSNIDSENERDFADSVEVTVLLRQGEIDQQDSITSDHIETDTKDGNFNDDGIISVPTEIKGDDVISSTAEKINDTIVYQEVYVEKTTLITFADKGIQVDTVLDDSHGVVKSDDVVATDEAAGSTRFSDKVDSEISSIADKIFGFVNLAGKLTRKIHRPKTSQGALMHNDFDEHRPSTLPAISRDDISRIREENSRKNSHRSHREDNIRPNEEQKRSKQQRNTGVNTNNDHTEPLDGVRARDENENKINPTTNRKNENNVDPATNREEDKFDSAQVANKTAPTNVKVTTESERHKDLNPNLTEKMNSMKPSRLASGKHGDINNEEISDVDKIHGNTGRPKEATRQGKRKETDANEANKVSYIEKTFPESRKPRTNVSVAPTSDKYEKSTTKYERGRHTLQPSTSQTNGDNESMERSWTESGFFDDSSLNSTRTVRDNRSFWHGQAANKHTGWNRLRYGRSHQVLRFLSRIAKSKCSLLSHESNNIHKEAKTAEEAVVGELSVFAEHAIDLLDIISFALKRIEIEHAEEELENKLAEQTKNASLVAKSKTTWEQESSVAAGSDAASRKVQFHESKQDNLTENYGEKPKARNSARHSARQHDVPADDEDKVAKAARKRRQRILDRHKKLVERLRASGVGMKQICTILGISRSPNDDDNDLMEEEEHPLPPALKKAQQEQIRRMSLIGHSFNGAPTNHIQHFRTIHEQPDKKSMFPTMGRKANHLIDATKMYGHQRKSFASNAGGVMRRSSLFPPIPIKATGAGPSAMITNFFKTKPLANMR